MINQTKLNFLLVIVALVLIGCGGGGDGGATAPVNGGGGAPPPVIGGGDLNDPPGGPAPEPASTQFVSSGSGYSAAYDAWNCGGLEGIWQMEGEITMPDLGTIQTTGPVTFTMPPRPDSGPWNSHPFSYTMSGTLYPADNVRADVTYAMYEIVNTIILLDDGPTLMDSRGSGTSTVTVTGPDFSHTVSETYDDMIADIPALIVLGPHPECN